MENDDNEIRTYKLKDTNRYIEYHGNDEGYDFTLYDSKGNPIDGGVLETDNFLEQEKIFREITGFLEHIIPKVNLELNNLERVNGIEEVGDEKYEIVIWENEDEREQGISQLLDIIENKERVVIKAKEIWWNNSFESLEVRNSNKDTIFFIDKEEEQYFKENGKKCGKEEFLKEILLNKSIKNNVNEVETINDFHKQPAIEEDKDLEM